MRKKENLCKKAAALGLAGLLWAGAALPVQAAERERCVVPMGNAVSIEMTTDGIMVVGLSRIETDKGLVSPAEEAGLVPGDVIVRLGGADTRCAEDFTKALGSLDGGPVSVTVRRGGKLIQYSLQPLMGKSGAYQLGLWLRDRVSGVGTLTFYDPETGLFGALGHPITDMQSGELMPLGGGRIADTSIVDVLRGSAGVPGELCGLSDGSDKRGDITRNTLCGIFGTMTPGGLGAMREAVPVACEGEIKLGKACILATVSGKEVREYGIEITRIYHDSGDGRCMMLSVTDPELLSVTGGIVQGMSGSPILQNGKLVGAVTHVLVSDPARGYGVSAEAMLDTALDATLDNAA